MKYLGVPLLSKQLGVNDCKSLIENVEERINSWRNKCLSYAGKMQLIASVLSAMQQYWASVYILPVTVIKDLEKIFKRFLWSSGKSAKGKARVAWKYVCRPKDQGGLGFRPLKKWNEVLMVAQLWKIIDNEESLWVKWVNIVKLKGNSIWHIEYNNSDSWGWKQLLMIRDNIRSHVKKIVGNGKTTSMWYDNWSVMGPFNRIVHNKDLYEARMNLNDSVVDLINNEEWLWPDEWTSKFPELQQVNVPLLSDVEDRAVWVDIGGNVSNYSTKVAWESLRDNLPKVEWSHVVWFTQCTPKLAFILWLAIQGKLLTQDRMMVWYQGDELKCSLCNKCIDSHQHLFFECEFSDKVWKEMKAKGKFMESCHDLNSVVCYIANGGNKNNIWSIVNKIITAAVVYFLWNERNKRMFQDSKRDVDEVISVINRYVESVLQSIRVKKSRAVLMVARSWNLTWEKERLVPAIEM